LLFLSPQKNGKRQGEGREGACYTEPLQVKPAPILPRQRHNPHLCLVIIRYRQVQKLAMFLLSLKSRSDFGERPGKGSRTQPGQNLGRQLRRSSLPSNGFSLALQAQRSRERERVRVTNTPTRSVLGRDGQTLVPAPPTDGSTCARAAPHPNLLPRGKNRRRGEGKRHAPAQRIGGSRNPPG